MTTIELRTSIAAELDQMSVEMLESVSRYVKRLRHQHRRRSAQPQQQPFGTQPDIPYQDILKNRWIYSN